MTLPELPDISKDFHTLTSSEVEIVLQYADKDKYRAPKNANGSRARYYWGRLQRHARFIEKLELKEIKWH